MTCPNLVVFKCVDVSITASEYISGDPYITLSVTGLFQSGVREIVLLNPRSAITLTGPDVNGVYPCSSEGLDVTYPAQIVTTHSDCYLVNRTYQVCTGFPALVSGRANTFTYIGSLAESQVILRGSWCGKTLSNGIYPAIMRTEDDSEWVSGTVRVIPWPASPLRYRPFGKKIQALWSNSAYTDPRVANDTYLSELSLPTGI